MFSDPSRVDECYEYLFVEKVRGAKPKNYAEFDELISTLIKRINGSDATGSYEIHERRHQID